MEPRALCMLGKGSITELYTQPIFLRYKGAEKEIEQE